MVVIVSEAVTTTVIVLAFPTVRLIELLAVPDATVEPLTVMVADESDAVGVTRTNVFAVSKV